MHPQAQTHFPAVTDEKGMSVDVKYTRLKSAMAPSSLGPCIQKRNPLETATLLTWANLSSMGVGELEGGQLLASLDGVRNRNRRTLLTAEDPTLATQ